MDVDRELIYHIRGILNREGLDICIDDIKAILELFQYDDDNVKFEKTIQYFFDLGLHRTRDKFGRKTSL